MVEKVFEFPRGRAKPLSEAEALGRLLEQIRREGRVEVESITALGKAWGWEQSRTSKAVTRWERAGHIMREQGAGGKIIIRFPGQERQESEQEQAQEGAQEWQEAQEQRHEQSIVSAQELGVPADVPGVPAGVPATLPVVHVPAIVPAPVVKQPLELHDLLVWCQWILGAVLIGLSVALYIVGLNLNATFWPGLDPIGNSKGILRAGGAIIETVNYVVPSAIALAQPRLRPRPSSRPRSTRARAKRCSIISPTVRVRRPSQKSSKGPASSAIRQSRQFSGRCRQARSSAPRQACTSSRPRSRPVRRVRNRLRHHPPAIRTRNGLRALKHGR
jgi:hypothetical protein